MANGARSVFRRVRTLPATRLVSVAWRERGVTFAWVICVLVIGQIGILGMWAVKGLPGLLSCVEAGSLYTFAISCLGSGVFDVARDLLTGRDRFRGLRLTFLLVAIGLSIFMALLFGSGVRQPTLSSVQVVLYFTSLGVALMATCCSLLELDYGG